MSGDLEAVEDPRAVDRPICGVTRTHGNTEFICIKDPHQKVTQRRNAAYPEFRTDAASAAHYFVNRWPNRGRSDT